MYIHRHDADMEAELRSVAGIAEGALALSSEEFAQRLDEADPLRRFRDECAVPLTVRR